MRMGDIDLTVSEPANAEECEYVRELALRASGLGKEAADIAGVIEDLAAFSKRQAETFAQLQSQTTLMGSSNAQIQQSADEAEQVASRARDAVGKALDGTRVLAHAVHRVEQGVNAVSSALGDVSDAAREIGEIALQTRLVAFNASVEAVRAGEAGRGFAVVAGAVKDLAQKVHNSSQSITRTVQDLGRRIAELSRDANLQGGGQSSDAAGAVEAAVRTFHEAFDKVEQKVHAITSAAEQNRDSCTNALAAFGDLSAGANNSTAGLERARGRTAELLSLSEQLIDLTAESGVQTEDTPYINAVLDAAARISSLFEQAVEAGEITLPDLGDSRYEPIPGTNPQQHMTRFVEFTDRTLPPIQEPMLELSDKVVFCAAVDRNGYLPTHNLKFSKPQGPDVAWNTANCRNRRIFNDRTGLAAGRNSKRFLLQTYRRDMGGGKYALMKDLSAPITAHGRHWGGLRLAYRFE